MRSSAVIGAIFAALIVAPGATAQRTGNGAPTTAPTPVAPIPLYPELEPEPDVEIDWSVLHWSPEEGGQSLELPAELGADLPIAKARCRVDKVTETRRREGDEEITELTSSVRCEDASVRISGTRFGEMATGCAYNRDATLVTGGRATFFISDSSGQDLGSVTLRCRARRPGIPVEEVFPANAADTP